MLAKIESDPSSLEKRLQRDAEGKNMKFLFILDNMDFFSVSNLHAFCVSIIKIDDHPMDIFLGI